jgi:molecular chaperone GrpE
MPTPQKRGEATVPEETRPSPEQGSPPPNGSPDGAGAAISPQELAALQKRAAERDQFLDLLQRTRADFENFQKRNRLDREQERKYQYGPLVRDLLPVLDNLQRALEAAEKVGEKGPLVQGVHMVQGQFLEQLKRHGITRIEAQQGRPFDPHLHEAIQQVPVPGQPPNTVVQVVEYGFMNQDRVLRPAKVIVSTGA